MKRALLALLLLAAFAAAVTVTSHDIEITLKADGSGYVVEDFLVRLTNGDKDSFKAALAAGTPETVGLKPVITKEHGEINIIPRITESDIASVTFQYNVPQIVDSVGKRGKQELVGITEKAFSFYDGKTMQLPYEPPTTLAISVPQDFKLADNPIPSTEPPVRELGVDGKQYLKYTWTYLKPFNTNQFRVLYEQEISIQSQLSLGSLLDNFRNSYGNPLYLVAAAILVLILLCYRKEVVIVVKEAFAGEPVIEGEEAEKA
jgi:hypothetical protein